MPTEAKRRRGSPTVSRILPDGRLVELVYRPEDQKTLLAVCQDGRATVVEYLDLDHGERLVPVAGEHNLIKHGVLLLPEAPEPFDSVSELVSEVQAHIHRYVDLSAEFEKVASYYILLSWVYDAFNELPYLRLRGDYGSGKTRALLVLGSLCYKAFFASGASTVSPIFHTLDMFRGTLVFDEADFRFSDEKAEVIKILNNGNAKGFPVLRSVVTPQHQFEPRAFAVYGPKVVAMRQSFDDQALESRFITEEMGQRKLRGDVPINLPGEQAREARALRNKLLMYRFTCLGRMKIDESLRDHALSPRMNQILLPLLSIIDVPELREELRRSAGAFEHDLRVERSAAPEAELLGILSELMDAAERSTVPIKELATVFNERYGGDYDRPITNRYVGFLLRKRLRLTSYKSHGVYVVPLTERQKVEALCVRYGIHDASSDSSDAGVVPNNDNLEREQPHGEGVDMGTRGTPRASE